MTDKTPAFPGTSEKDPEAAAKQRVAKGAAQELIGKLIGDDAEVTKGRAEQRAAKAALGKGVSDGTSGDVDNGTRKPDGRDPGGDAGS